MDEKDKKRLISTVGTRGNCRAITITDNKPEHWDDIISIGKSSYEDYFYIFHDKDDTDKHLHILLLDKGGTTLKRHCERFSSVIPANFVEKVRSPRAMARYLIHKDQPDKFQYDSSLVITNNKDKYASYLLDHNNDVVKEYQDYLRLFRGEITIDEYLDKYRGEFSTMPFYQKTAFFHKIASTDIYKSITSLSQGLSG